MIAGLLLVRLAAANPQDQSTGAAPPASETVVPRLVSFAGTVIDPKGAPVTAPVTLTFSLYTFPEGGNPLWVETQKVQLDDQGHYTVLLGSTQPSGLPLDLFTTGQAQWLGVQPDLPGFGEQPRVLLVGMPYALKAADADTLGGLPPSAFAMAAAGSSAANETSSAATSEAQGNGTASPATFTITGCATANTLALFTASSAIANSLITQSAGAAVVSEALPMPALGTATSSAGFNSQPHDCLASAYSSSTQGAVAPSGKFNLLFASGTGTPVQTGLSISSKGILSFASGQTSPGTGSRPGCSRLDRLRRGGHLPDQPPAPARPVLRRGRPTQQKWDRDAQNAQARAAKIDASEATSGFNRTTIPASIARPSA